MSCCLTRLALVVCLLSSLLLPGCGESNTPAPANTPGTGPTPTPAATTAPAGREGWPTEEEIKVAIHKVEHAIWASQTNKEVWKVKDMKHEIKSITLANETTEKQMDYGRQAITVYPVKVVYTRVTDYEHKEATREEIGGDGVWYLYKDAFGQWTGKYARD